MERRNTQPGRPRYKDKLQTKHLKASSTKISFSSSHWDSVSMNLEDCAHFSSSVQSGSSAVIFHNSRNNDSRLRPRKGPSKECACFSKQKIQKQIYREYLVAMEENLKQHRYQQYKDHIEPELFDKVLSVLDPDTSVNSASALPAPAAEHAEDEEDHTKPREVQVEATHHNKISPRNPFTLQMNGSRMRKGPIVHVKQLHGSEGLKAIDKLFSSWFVSQDEEADVTECGSLDGDLRDLSLTSAHVTLCAPDKNVSSVSGRQ